MEAVSRMKTMQLLFYAASLTDIQMRFTVVVPVCLPGLVLFQINYATLYMREGTPKLDTVLQL